MCFSCDTYSRVIQKQVCTSFHFITGASNQNPIFSIDQMFGILVSVHEQRVGYESGCLVIFSKRNNLKESVKKMNCITLLLTQSTELLFYLRARLLWHLASRLLDSILILVLLESHRSGRDHYWMRSCWMCLYTPYPTIKTRMIVYSLSFQPRLAPPACRSIQHICRAWIWFGYQEMDTGRFRFSWTERAWKI